jgi:hypothetical protein
MEEMPRLVVLVLLIMAVLIRGAQSPGMKNLGVRSEFMYK